jgi:hypothetical protein
MARKSNGEVLAMALIGFAVQRKKVVEAIANLRTELASRSQARGRTRARTATPKPRTHRLSAEGRERIAAAQRKRWRQMKRRMAEAAAKRTGTAKRRKSSAGETNRQLVHRRDRVSPTKTEPPLGAFNPSNAAAENAVSPQTAAQQMQS